MYTPSVPWGLSANSRSVGFRLYSTGEKGTVEIESEWTGRRRERMGMPLQVKVREQPHPSKTGSDGAPSKS
jgi:hypothetical protein